MNLFFCLIIFFLGACVGSFLNSIIYRLHAKEGFLTGHSRCPKCNHQLSWRDLVPIFSFLFLGARCRYCKEKISFQYPLVEIATAFLFISIFQSTINNQQLTIPAFVDFIYLLIVTCFLIIIFVYDLKHYIIPDKILYPAIGVTFLYRLFEVLDFGFDLTFGFCHLDFKSLLNPLTSAFLASTFFLFIYLISRGQWMGFGDVKLALFMGLFLGLPNIIYALFLAFFIGAFVGILLIIFGKKTLKSEVPFAPFLIISTFLSLFWGETLVGAFYFLLL